MSGLAGKVAIVTGATEGIGAAVSRSLSAQGARVVGVARRPEPGERLVQELGEAGAAFVAGDVAEPGHGRARRRRVEEPASARSTYSSTTRPSTSPGHR